MLRADKDNYLTQIHKQTLHYKVVPMSTDYITYPLPIVSDVESRKSYDPDLIEYEFR